MSKHIHILGICGTFMGSLAILAKQKGYKVTGCDLNVYPPMSTYLESQGIEIIKGFNLSQLDSNPDEIIIGNIMKRGMPIIEKILDDELDYYSGPSWLYKNILKNKKVIAISGTHGKTTTTTMVIKILEQAGLNPSFLVGGISSDFKVSSRYTDSDYFVIEADEYDTSFFDKRSKFFHYKPNILVINNLEFDHADIFKSIDAIYWQFHQLLRRMPSKEKIIYNDNEYTVKHLINMGCWSQKIPVNTSENIHIKTDNDDYSNFNIIDKENILNIKWNLIGLHNALNALSAYTVAKQLNISEKNIKKALESFNGVKRRMEVIYKSNNITIYDDFAHHPTSIQLTIDAIKKAQPNSYTIALLDPRSNTMKSGENKDKLPLSLSKADTVLFYNHSLLKWNAKETFKGSSNIKYMQETEDFHKNILEIKQTYKHKKINIVFMGNGSFDGLRESVIRIL